MAVARVKCNSACSYPLLQRTVAVGGGKGVWIAPSRTFCHRWSLHDRTTQGWVVRAPAPSRHEVRRTAAGWVPRARWPSSASFAGPGAETQRVGGSRDGGGWLAQRGWVARAAMVVGSRGWGGALARRLWVARVTAFQRKGGWLARWGGQVARGGGRIARAVGGSRAEVSRWRHRRSKRTHGVGGSRDGVVRSRVRVVCSRGKGGWLARQGINWGAQYATEYAHRGRALRQQ